MNNQYKIEGEIEWSLEFHGSTIIIEIGRLDKTKFKRIIYNCEYNPIAGYDNFDLIMVDGYLQKYISEFQK